RTCGWLLEFAGTCSRKRDEILNAQLNGELLPETLGLQSWCAVQSTRPFVEALSGLLIGLESQVPRIYSKTTPPLLEKYGFAEDEVTFFTLHIVADAEHGEKGFEIVEKYATTADQQAACVRLVKEATMMRGLYLDGVYRKFIAEPQTAGKKLAA